MITVHFVDRTPVAAYEEVSLCSLPPRHFLTDPSIVKVYRIPTDPSEMRAVCHGNYTACAYPGGPLGTEAGVCWIFVPLGDDGSCDAHERAHCNGWMHSPRASPE